MAYDPRHRIPPASVHGAERSPSRDRRHLAVMVLPWLLMAVLWVRVLRAGPAALVLPSGLIAVCAVVTVALTAAWIAHNLAIYREKGPRTGLPAVELAYDHDWTGRRVLADWDAVRAARVVVVAAGEADKRFLPQCAAAVPAATAARRPHTSVNAAT